MAPSTTCMRAISVTARHARANQTWSKTGLLSLSAQPVSRQSMLQIQRRQLSDDSRKKIEQAVAEKPLVVFMKGTPDFPQCGFSRAVVQILEVQGVSPDSMKTYNCLEDQELREGIKEFSSWPTIPQVYIKGEFVGGCDIMLGMHQSGELEKMLQEQGVVSKSSSSSSSSETAIDSIEPRTSLATAQNGFDEVDVEPATRLRIGSPSLMEMSPLTWSWWRWG
ncbi:uncharacterized protein L969DRAFT_93573 [Mixia osmundae IAM 14324]|uniref:uncharacterized protein n=1 Tax=Mixia osmundae (strain CBS 9802 / IAM 14324 / JCM 22182 / KY 12970) TaxID=764103 RepID=UPI0004A54D4E|nr:uncharacterized protein L969DRAFT_93573 [Mixia osmundae IAM 14324]KEI41064.1 hypothetical protein L969DRAFT_93573 [Mixia osmundae IAM 14324]